MKSSKRNKENEKKRRKKTDDYLKMNDTEIKSKKKIASSKYAKKRAKRIRGINNENSPITPVVIFALLIFMIIACSKDLTGTCDNVRDPEMITVTINDNNKVVQSVIGDTINFDLPTCHGSGYQWYFESQWDTTHLKYLGSNMNIRYIEPYGKETGYRMLNITRKTTIIRFRVIETGISKIELVNFRYYESWKEFTVYPTYPFDIIVNSN